MLLLLLLLLPPPPCPVSPAPHLQDDAQLLEVRGICVAAVLDVELSEGWQPLLGECCCKGRPDAGVFAAAHADGSQVPGVGDRQGKWVCKTALQQPCTRHRRHTTTTPRPTHRQRCRPAARMPAACRADCSCSLGGKYSYSTSFQAVQTREAIARCGRDSCWKTASLTHCGNPESGCVFWCTW